MSSAFRMPLGPQRRRQAADSMRAAPDHYVRGLPSSIYVGCDSRSAASRRRSDLRLHSAVLPMHFRRQVLEQ
jgi:hypothetical protein